MSSCIVLHQFVLVFSLKFPCNFSLYLGNRNPSSFSQLWSLLLYPLSFRYPYIAVVLNFSQMWALYCLVQFYNVTHERLKPIKPLAKFISFKAIVFATWWQGVGIALLCTIEILPKEEKFQTGLQDFLISIEVRFFFWKACIEISYTLLNLQNKYPFINAVTQISRTHFIVRG